MTPHCTFLSSIHSRTRSLTVHTADGSSLSVAGKGTLLCSSFHVPDVSYVPDLTMQLMSAGQLTDHSCHVIPNSDFCYVQDRHTGHLVDTSPRHHDSQRLWELAGFVFVPLRLPVLTAPLWLLMASSIGSPLWLPSDYSYSDSSWSLRIGFRSRVFSSVSGLSYGKADLASP
ncbi:hypothetical protein U9M48_039399 [Paspalum notatum var. saurae]|uniref:Retrovirus-related Pol polyprotein from transposon TNT 1-94-like beta-barrel domain-containing protein n=1 Tax=Paspalum notatum var. saurae TaxID=547442 RepID=A0AAQ3UK09_PASNO